MVISAQKPRPFVVVLTGGIASGKTTVSDLFARKGMPIIDTDLIARELVQPEKPALARIAAQFGNDYLLPDGNLNRERMRNEIFTNPQAKRLLESILHPEIAKAVTERIDSIQSPYCILVIPLFAESSAYQWVDRVLVVDVPEQVQIERLTSRDGISKSDAENIINSQASRKQRSALADDIIQNSGSLLELEQQVEELHEKYIELAKSSNNFVKH